MSRIQVGDIVAFRREIARKCDSGAVADFRAIVTEITHGWLFMKEDSGRIKVMPSATMCKVARNGAILELV